MANKVTLDFEKNKITWDTDVQKGTEFVADLSERRASILAAMGYETVEFSPAISALEDLINLEISEDEFCNRINAFLAEDRPSKESCIVSYYVVPDLLHPGPILKEKDLTVALTAYFKLPTDRMKALGIEHTNHTLGCLDVIQCKEGEDIIINDWQQVPGWACAEIGAAVGRIVAALCD